MRVLNYYGAPYLATYDAASQTFTATGSALTFPAFYVARWRPQ